MPRSCGFDSRPCDVDGGAPPKGRGVPHSAERRNRCSRGGTVDAAGSEAAPTSVCRFDSCREYCGRGVLGQHTRLWSSRYGFDSRRSPSCDTSVTVTETDLVLTQGIPVRIRAGVLGEVDFDPHGSQGGRAVNAATIRLSRLPPTPLVHPCGSLEGTAEWSATGFERRGALTRRGSIPLPSSWSVTCNVREVGC